MMQRPEASVFRVFHTNGNIVGTGFLLAHDLGVTCIHVIEATGHRKGQPVQIQFASDTQPRSAHVITQNWSEADDVAFLSVEASDIKPVRLGYAGTSSGKAFLSFGYPEGGSLEERFANGIIQGLVNAENYAHKLLQIDGEKIDLGISGGPVWEVATGLVVGMVVAKEDLRRRNQGHGKQDAPSVRVGYAIPAETLRIVYPDLFDASVKPYLSLEAFTENDEEFFFGRTRDVEHMLDKLRRHSDFLVVLGASGSGKSSIVQAGIIPALRQGKLPESEHWEFLITRPANQPFDSLANVGLSQLDQGLTHSVQLWRDAHPNCKRLVLVIDQFEELLVGGISDVIQQKFTEQLADLLKTNLATVIITLRDDFFVPLLNRTEAFKPWLTNNLFHISPNLSRKELEEIIRKPADVAGLEFEEGLVQVILDDTMHISGGGGSSGILPLLEFSLTQLWRKCQQTGVLSHSAYRDLGCVSGGLVQWAEKAYLSLSEEQQPVARRILSKIVHLGDEKKAIPDSRRLCLLDSLVDSTLARQVVIHLSSKDHRLITVKRDDQGKETVEIIHDALLREWGRLQGWLKDDRQFLEWRQNIESRVEAWVKTSVDDEDQRDKSKLLRGSDLDEAERWNSERQLDLSNEEWEFVVSSSNLRYQEDAERDAQAKREYNLARAKAEAEQIRAEEQAHTAQRLRVRSRIITVLGLFALGIAVAAYIAWNKSVANEKIANQNAATAQAESLLRITAQLEAEGQAHVANARQLVAQAKSLELDTVVHVEQSVLLLVEALRRSPNVEATQFLRTNLKNLPKTVLDIQLDNTVKDADVSIDGMWLALGKSEGTIEFLNIKNGLKTSIQGHNGEVLSIAFSTDNSSLVSSGTDNVVHLWNVIRKEEIFSISLPGFIYHVGFTDAGSIIVFKTSSAHCLDPNQQCESEVLSLDPTNGNVIRRLSVSGNINVMEVSSGGQRLATGEKCPTSEPCRAAIVIWDLDKGVEVLKGYHNDSVISLAGSTPKNGG